MRHLLWSFIGCLVLAGCAGSKGNDTAVTLATGIKLTDDAQCLASPVKDAVSIQPTAGGHRIRVTGSFACQSDLEPPFLTESDEHKRTLALLPKRSGFGFHSTCECARSLSIDVAGRLKSGQRLYVLNDYDVVGDVVVP